MALVRNPILRGFNPDPSFVAVGDDFYLATSSFEWFPGVRIYHSRDLCNWQIVGDALHDIDLRGVPNSGGVWAPSLSYSDGLFYLVYTLVRTWRPAMPFKDVDNFLTTAREISGPWSPPVYLNSVGFDPSLFHDADGRKWIVQMEWDYRKNKPRFAGIVLQEYSDAAGQLVGDRKTILRKPGLVEGPNIYKRNGYYYLMTAEGGTGWHHAISMARSETIDGEYQADPQEFVVTSRLNHELPLQKAGHGELVETADGEWYLAHLASRPFGASRSCVLGRETCLQKVRWDEDGWLRLEHGGHEPDEFVAVHLQEVPTLAVSGRDDFDSEVLMSEWNSLRVPVDESWASLSVRKGWLRLRGRESIRSLFNQSLVARRLTSLTCQVTTKIDFAPRSYQHAAGLVVFYNTEMNYYLRVSHDDGIGKYISVVLNDAGNYDELEETRYSVDEWDELYLRAALNGLDLQFYVSPDNELWHPIGDVLTMEKLSDDYGELFHFTGTFVGLCCQDLASHEISADFDFFEILESEKSE